MNTHYFLCITLLCLTSLITSKAACDQETGFKAIAALMIGFLGICIPCMMIVIYTCIEP